MKHRETPPMKPYIEEAPKLELKALLPHMRYVFLDRDDHFAVINVAYLNGQQWEYLVEVLKGFKLAISLTTADFIRIPFGIFSHKI